VTEEHDDDAPRGTTPGAWAELIYRVGEASFVKVFNPDNPLVKIGDFDAISMIGQGGFGIVFKARDPELDRLVALKLCRTCSKSASDALLREAKVLAKLHHPNIITIFELGHHDGAVFFVMPYIAGQNAERFAERDPAPSVQEILRVYLHVARGLEAAHAEGIVHGDIKPSNFLLDSDDFARIADFGLARRMIEDADESEQEGLRRRAGTLYYMAPEALCGEPCNARSDQFSFFVALCQALTRGKLPFYGKTSGAVLDAMEQTDILQFLDPWLPAELKALIRIGLSLEPDERFPDMATVEAEIDRLLQTLPPSSPPRDDEPESDESDEPELTPLGGGPAPSKAKLGTFAALLVLVGAVCLTIGWMGRGRVEVSHTSDPISSSRGVKMPMPSHRGWTNGLASYSHALQAIDRGDLRAGHDAWVAGHFNVSRSTPGFDGELSLLLAKRVDERSPGSFEAAWIVNGAAESFELAQNWRRAAEAREVAAELARAANREWLAEHQERCVLVNAMGRPC
jgi:serine/threonine protein kinase